MEEALIADGRVLFAIPRRDVVRELEPRLRKAFPGEEITCLYGGSSGKFRQASIVIATTHQAIRFYRAFDLVILDEVDAFPYSGSAMLHHILQRTRKPEGKFICMTATPDQAMLQKVKIGETALIRIPARHHGFPLPEPALVIEKELRHKEGQVNLPALAGAFLESCLKEGTAQVFVFIPGVNLAPLVAREIARGLGVGGGEERVFPSGELVQWSHAKDPQRDQKREAFSQGKIRVFVTTTIMERGITVPHAHVLVLFADQERIFDPGALIQMAGRAGRSTKHPTGRVCFIGSRKTPAMVSAAKAIQEMNREAFQRGYLHGVREKGLE